MKIAKLCPTIALNDMNSAGHKTMRSIKELEESAFNEVEISQATAIPDVVFLSETEQDLVNKLRKEREVAIKKLEDDANSGKTKMTAQELMIQKQNIEKKLKESSTSKQLQDIVGKSGEEEMKERIVKAARNAHLRKVTVLSNVNTYSLMGKFIETGGGKLSVLKTLTKGLTKVDSSSSREVEHDCVVVAPVNGRLIVSFIQVSKKTLICNLCNLFWLILIFIFKGEDKWV